MMLPAGDRTEAAATISLPGLRRADWRFLLPAPAASCYRHLILLGGSAVPALAEKLSTAGVAYRISTCLPNSTQAKCDALILLHDSPWSLEQAISYLQPGGLLYQEIKRRLAGPTPYRYQHHLRSLGLTPTGLYWVAPNFTDPKRYLSLDAPGVLAWYLSTIFVAGTPWHRLAEWGLRLLTAGRSQRFAPFVPCYAVTATAGPPGRNQSPALLNHPHLPAWLKQQPRLHPVLLTSGQDDGSRVVMLPFTTDSREPIAALKLARLPAFNPLTNSEQNTLKQLHHQLAPNLHQTIPTPHGLLDFGSLTVSLENYVAGRSLWTSIGRYTTNPDQKIADLQLAAGWLADYHRQTQVERLCWQPAAIEQWLEQPFAAYEAAFGLTPTEHQLFTAARRYAHTLIGTELPLVWRHLDFAPWNLYRQGKTITVIDWEPYTNWQRGRTGPALCDLLYFVTYWTFIAHRLHDEPAEIAGFRALYLRPAAGDRLSQAVETTITTYLDQLQLDPRFRPLLALYLWLDRALDRLDRQRLLGIAHPPRLSNRYIQYLALLAEAPHHLFPT